MYRSVVLPCARTAKGRKVRGEQGAAALEFALIAPFLFALILGIIGYGYMLSFRQGISQSAAEGARAAAVVAADGSMTEKEAAAVAAVNRSLESYGVTCGGGNLTKDGTDVGDCTVGVAACDGDASRECASVRVNYAYRANPLIPGIGVTLPEKLDYTAVAEVS